MNRYIDADWIVQELEWWRDKLAETHGENDEYVLCLGEVLMKLDDTPTADVRENVKGEWVMEEKPMIGKPHIVQCSICGNVLDMYGVNAGRGDANFCPNCGADMRG